ncbi:MAG: Gfo/Idh/MocA family protein [Armatimonadota bacterium]
MKRIAVIGAGNMARRRAEALLATGQAEICGVAARHIDSAQQFGAEVGCDHRVDDYRQLLVDRPDAVLVEVPHAAQDAIVRWALDAGLHVLIGGPLATASGVGEEIRDLAARRGLVVEAGYQARYMPLWEQACNLLQKGMLGNLVAVRTIALWAGEPASWYYAQEASGGMPLTHMTYCFLNPLRWLLGDPRQVSAFANRKGQTSPGMIDEETCVANLLFPDDVLCSSIAGFVKPGELPSWHVTLIGTQAILELHPIDMEGGNMTMYAGPAIHHTDYSAAPDGFVLQAQAFLAALDGAPTCRNTPEDTIGDLYAAEAIVTSARDKRTVDCLNLDLLD